MPGCILNASGANFDVDAFLATSGWRNVANIFRRDEPTGIKLRPDRQYSGFGIHVSDLEEERLDPQIQDATKFIHENGPELERLAAFPGVDDIEFFIGLFWHEDTVCSSFSLPSQFLLLAGKHRISVTLNIYEVSEE